MGSHSGCDNQADDDVCSEYMRRILSEGMETLVTEHDGHMLARLEADDRVFEVRFDAIEPTDVTLRFLRDDDHVGSIYNDDGTSRTMATPTTAREGSDFIAVEVPKSFVAEFLNAALAADRVTDATALEGYRLRVV